MKDKSILSKGKRFLQRNKRRLIHTWQTMWAKRHYYTLLQSYVFECPDKAEILSMRNESTVYAVQDNGIVLRRGGQVAVKKALIRNASCFVYSDIILLEDGGCIYSAKEHEGWQGVVDFMDEILLKDTETWCKLKKCHQTKQIAKAIKVGGMFGFNYYHFIFQILPRLLETSDIDPSIPLLLDRTASDVPSMRQLADWCNAEKREVIYMDYDVAYQVEELYIISSPNACVPNWKRGADTERVPAALYSIAAIDKVSKCLLPYKDIGDYPEKIFISRKSTKRRAYNEAELWEVAEKYGFVKVYPEELNVAEQIALFNNARTIIAANGAALSNLIFCSSGCKLIMLCSGELAVRVFAPLMPIKSGQVALLMPISVSKGYQNSFEISPVELEELLTKDKNEADYSK